MQDTIQRFVFGLALTCGLMGLNATGCSAGLQGATSIMLGAGADDIVAAVQSAPLKQVAIY